MEVSTKRDRSALTSKIRILAAHIRAAADYLVKKQNYTLDELCYVTGGGDRLGRKNGRFGHDPHKREVEGLPHPDVLAAMLHKNSLLKLRDMRIAHTVMVGQRGKRLRWLEILPGEQPGGVDQWLWSPQIDTVEKLELLVAEASRYGFQPPMVQLIIAVAPTEKALPAMTMKKTGKPKALPKKAIRAAAANAKPATKKPALEKAPPAPPAKRGRGARPTA